jgi:hypothetical protein
LPGDIRLAVGYQKCDDTRYASGCPLRFSDRKSGASALPVSILVEFDMSVSMMPGATA